MKKSVALLLALLPLAAAAWPFEASAEVRVPGSGFGCSSQNRVGFLACKNARNHNKEAAKIAEDTDRKAVAGAAEKPTCTPDPKGSMDCHSDTTSNPAQAARDGIAQLKSKRQQVLEDLKQLKSEKQEGVDLGVESPDFYCSNHDPTGGCTKTGGDAPTRLPSEAKNIPEDPEGKSLAEPSTITSQLLKEQAQTYNMLVETRNDIDKEIKRLEALANELEKQKKKDNGNAGALNRAPTGGGDITGTSPSGRGASPGGQGGGDSGGAGGGGQPQKQADGGAGGGESGGGSGGGDSGGDDSGSGAPSIGTSPTPKGAGNKSVNNFDDGGTSDPGSKKSGTAANDSGGKSAMGMKGGAVDISPVAKKKAAAKEAALAAGAVGGASSEGDSQDKSRSASPSRGKGGRSSGSVLGGGGEGIASSGEGGGSSGRSSRNGSGSAGGGGDSNYSASGGGSAASDEVLSPFGTALSDPKISLAGSEVDASVKNMLGEFGGAPSADGTVASGASRAPAGEVYEGIGEKNSSSLFERLRAFHDRCMKSGCVSPHKKGAVGG